MVNHTQMSTVRTVTPMKRVATAIAGSTAFAATLAGIATGTAAPAYAADHYSAVAYSSNGSWGWAMLATTAQQAVDMAVSYCTGAGGDCFVNLASDTNGCVAVAATPHGLAAAKGSTNAGAQMNAQSKLGGKGKIWVSTCAGQPGETTPPTGGGGFTAVEAPPPAPAPAPAPAPEPAPAPAPKKGPTVSWDPILGGLVAHITDRSGVSSQCTYTSDFFTRSFALNANSTFDLRIVPAIPQFRNWDVAINCDNGTSTHTTTFF